MLNVLLLFLYLNLCSICCYTDCFDTEIFMLKISQLSSNIVLWDIQVTICELT